MHCTNNPEWFSLDESVWTAQSFQYYHLLHFYLCIDRDILKSFVPYLLLATWFILYEELQKEPSVNSSKKMILLILLLQRKEPSSRNSHAIWAPNHASTTSDKKGKIHLYTYTYFLFFFLSGQIGVKFHWDLKAFFLLPCRWWDFLSRLWREVNWAFQAFSF